jgi:succinate dehydrogenase / fumarate reductase cytochrome b subunit
MNNLTRFYQSSLGKKYIMAVTGFALFVFVIIHMLGNLQIFLGPGPINSYAEFLKARPALLWTARIGLLAVALLHIVSALQLARANRAARPVKYEENKVVAAGLASQTILFSGLIILAFIIYHLLHFTVGVTHPELLQLRDSLGRHDVYRMMVIAFSNIGISVFYIVSMGLLLLHLSHGVSSLFQSLGLRRKAMVRGIDRFARVSALVIFLGNCAIVIAVLMGYVK